ncbi:MAG: hypothetical protein ACD_31C00002G0026 [uncultured bacterium]|uniref:UDP-N-acetylenolpyruvoylglucosamine reductase n=4 Tax=Candidatus Daviesiibacteriota TaxID=1752718 RepID=A0A0G0EP87_9BACT|nr:MAG: hypothetical protein ACD_31C00002G0026 [uncultured bacterium]KKQ07302.1 MAG: UDP-N-acetylenolpyruvoylglucosamine reductase [Candidatus Daviesbacteria bacterium GW2011_GWB1_36_5]KKQ15653.1 MAG: UDP-N-acetylenolpyruvoylglucosamine reductase [Candidatus Daviesbacteria bacterium GW2011_GWA1_36_8]OGE17490.1 MAG: hypothetical protein A2858_01110 [Candidatus Daviesbacteria bacterium RIFCSPHIGHO2_01_FULL_36_37]OGE36585.1 MAG: hypothetical protein A3E66_02955 [Candidatus Daviesbacteria bacterium
MEDRYKLIAAALGEERVKYDERLIHHTYTKLKSRAEIFYIATTLKELIAVLDLAYELKIPYLVLGAGTKYLTKRADIKGLVIKNRTTQIKIGAIKGKVSTSGLGIEEAQIEVDSGVSINKLNDFLYESGLENLRGISSSLSTVGGAIFLDSVLQAQASMIKVWDKGDIENVDILSLDKNKHVVLSVVFGVKARI